MSAPTPAADEPIFFWKPQEHPYGIFCQWYPSAFTTPSPFPNYPELTFLCTEQYMMYNKAILFHDNEIAKQIMATSNPRKQKSLGRKVKGFDDKKWNEHRERIVEEGNWHKFCNAKEEVDLKDKLLATGDRELVEASPLDSIWGCGFDAENALANRKDWGLNLLGKALMKVRERLRAQEKLSTS